MEENIQSVDKQVEQKPKNHFPIPSEVLLGFLLIPVLILIAALVFWWKNVEKPQTPPTAQKTKETSAQVNVQARKNALLDSGGKVPQNSVVAIVQDETLYGKDLNYELISHFPAVFDTNDPLPKDIKTSALEQITNESLILQMAQSKGILKLDDTFFNNPQKDYKKRVAQLTKAQEELTKIVESKISVAGIVIYFNNQPDPKNIPPDAKEKTKKKVEALRTDLTTKKISIKEAGEKIVADYELEQIDPNYKANSYIEYKNINHYIPIKGSENTALTETIWKLNKGDITDILLGYRLNAKTGKSEEAFWSVFVVNDKTDGLSDTFENWFKAEKTKYKVETK